jgi:HAD superfamily phosphatase (TIGR01668 family)
MLEPDLQVASVADIDPAWLRERDVRGILIDSDDTLVPGDDGPISPDALAWIDELRAAGMRFAILSNGTPGRIAALGERLGIPAFAMAGKPFGFAFRRALEAIGTTLATTAMVGDQLFTDVLGARCAGLTSVLVAPLTPGRHRHTRVARRLERWVLAGGERARPLDR